MTAGELLKAAHELPFRDLSEWLGTGAAVILAPHPDDESLACGGMIALAREEERRVVVVFISDGVGSHPNSREYPPARLRALREEEARLACCELGVDAADVHFSGLPDRFVPQAGSIAVLAIDDIADCVERTGATSLFVTWRHDPHCDHQAAYRIAREVQRRRPGTRLFEYVVWGAKLSPTTDVQPIRSGFRLDTGAVMDKKRRAIAAHRSQTSDLISDDPTGFRLTADDLARFDCPYEYFLECDA